MKHFQLTIFLLVITAVFIGCAAAAPTSVPPTSAATVTPAPPTALPTQPPTKMPVPTQPLATPLPGTTPTAEGNTVIPDPTFLKLLGDAKTDLAARANVPVASITLTSAQAVEWKDASLDCPKLGVFYIQVITPGYSIVLHAAGKDWTYHTSNTRIQFCER